MKSKKSKTVRRRGDLSLSKVRSAIANGSRLLDGDVDMRLARPRRLRDLIAGYVSDLGGAFDLSEAQKALARSAAQLQFQLELMDSEWAENRDYKASPFELDVYQRVTNTLRRSTESLGLNRGTKVINLTQHALTLINGYADGDAA